MIAPFPLEQHLAETLHPVGTAPWPLDVVPRARRRRRGLRLVRPAR